MIGPVSETGNGVYFDFTGLDTAIVCIAPHCGLQSAVCQPRKTVSEYQVTTANRNLSQRQYL